MDCASIYENEHEVGQALSAVFAETNLKREDVFVCSKLWNSVRLRALPARSWPCARSATPCCSRCQCSPMAMICSRCAERQMTGTTGFLPPGGGQDHAAARVEIAVRKSLAALQLDYLDLYLIHWPVTGNRGADVQPSLLETWHAMQARLG